MEDTQLLTAAAQLARLRLQRRAAQPLLEMYLQCLPRRLRFSRASFPARLLPPEQHELLELLHYRRSRGKWWEPVFTDLQPALVWAIVPGGSVLLLRVAPLTWILAALGSEQSVLDAKRVYADLLTDMAQSALAEFVVEREDCHSSLVSLAVARTLFDTVNSERGFWGFTEGIACWVGVDGIEEDVQEAVRESLGVSHEEMAAAMRRAEQDFALQFLELESRASSFTRTSQSLKFAIGPHLLATTSHLASSSSQDPESPSADSSISLNISASPASAEASNTSPGVCWAFSPPQNRATEGDRTDPSKVTEDSQHWQQLVYVETERNSSDAETVKDEALVDVAALWEVAGVLGATMSDANTADSPEPDVSFAKARSDQKPDSSDYTQLEEHTQPHSATALFASTCGTTCPLL